MATNNSLLTPEAVIMFSIALIFDALTIVYTLLDILLGIGIVVGLILDMIPTIVIGIWMFVRSGKIVESKSTTKIKEKAGKGLIKAGEKLGGKAKTKLIKTAAKSLGKVGKRLLIPAIGSKIPLVQVFPFWTLTVYQELKGS